MSNTTVTPITVETTVNAPIDKVWDYWNEPKHIMNWCAASPDWHAPAATQDLRVGGVFSTTMAARDGSMSFEFGGTYTTVTKHQKIAYTLGDGRKVDITFEKAGNGVKIIETFDPESQNPVEMQRGGWQAIMDAFKKYTEEN